MNRNGERFANESSPYNDIVYAAAHQPGRVYAQICDANILEDAKRFHTIGCSAQTRNGGEKYIQGKMDEAIEAGALFKCDTLDELADKMALPARQRIPSWPLWSVTTSSMTSRTTRTSASRLPPQRHPHRALLRLLAGCLSADH